MLDRSMIRRMSNRLEGWDYSSVAAYFVTAVVRDRECLFGEVIDGEIDLNRFGATVDESWRWLEEQYDHVTLDAYVVMPNHLHGIVVISEDNTDSSSKDTPESGASESVPKAARRKPLGRLIGAFKTVSTKRINELRSTPGKTLWQRGFYDRVIRNESELEAVRDYILGNPAKWEEDAENPTNTT